MNNVDIIEEIPEIKEPIVTVKQPQQLLRIYINIFSIVFIEFLIMGISLGVLPTFVHETLGFSNFWVGVVIGAQYVATLCARQFSGNLADSAGGKKAVNYGLLLSGLSGVLLLLSGMWASYGVACIIGLIIARIVLGIGESLLVIGIFAWGFKLVGSAHTGKIMVWNGMGMYGGMACGAPIGMAILGYTNLALVFTLTIVLPMVAYLIMRLLPEVALPKKATQIPFYKAIYLIWRSGAGLALASIGFGGIASFISLYFIQHSWQGGSLALTSFGASYIIVRLFLAGAPDKYGGAKVAFISLLVELSGQLLVWGGFSSYLTIVGAALTGAGLSLVFPSFGQIAIKKVTPENRGIAMAAYNAFFDIGMAITAPLAGLLAGDGQYQHVYLFGASAVFVSALFALWELRKPN
ncbi:MFS transporter [Olivibacter ginsenosidimutans]|uniref:MFS transporter n=1 Tax=Olivibacter ginsenosidimutans TaxID=1176537 RepID=A0ABP9CGL7_9SPHI